MCVHVPLTDLRLSHTFRMCRHVRACASVCACMCIKWIHQNTAHMPLHMPGHDVHSRTSNPNGPHRRGTCTHMPAHMRAHAGAKAAAHTPTQG